MKSQQKLFAFLPEQSMSDECLVVLSKEGNHNAFTVLYLRYREKIFNMLFRMLKNIEVSEDLLQEASYQAWKNISKFKCDSTFYTWFYAIALNTCVARIRKDKCRAHLVTFNDEAARKLPVSPRIGTCPVKEAERAELFEEILLRINALTPLQRTAMLLGPIQGHTYEQIAEITGVGRLVVKGRLHRARENVKKALSCK